MYNLVVRNPFGGYPKGATITDPTTVGAILSDPHKASCVVKTAVPMDIPMIAGSGGGGSPSPLVPTSLAPHTSTMAGPAPTKPGASS